MDVIAKLRFYRQAPRKVRLVLALLPGKPVDVAESDLEHLNKGAAGPILKLLRSAVANAENNFKLTRDKLRVVKAFADEGPKLKRFRPAAFGMAHPILKRSSHVTIVLTDGGAAKPSVKPKEEAPKVVERKPPRRTRTKLIPKDEPAPTVMEKKDEKEMPHKDVIRRGDR